MNCANVRRMLSAYCDAELPSERRTTMRRHLHNCESCTAALETVKRLSSLTARWTELEPASSLWQALAPKLIAERRAPTEAGAEEMAVQPDPSQKRAAARRSFKPVIEGLEDRYPLSDLLYAAGATIAISVVEPVRAYLRSDGIWAAMADSTAGQHGAAVHGWAAVPDNDASGAWGDFGGAFLGAVA